MKRDASKRAGKGLARKPEEPHAGGHPREEKESLFVDRCQFHLHRVVGGASSRAEGGHVLHIIVRVPFSSPEAEVTLLVRVGQGQDVHRCRTALLESSAALVHGRAGSVNVVYE